MIENKVFCFPINVCVNQLHHNGQDVSAVSPKFCLHLAITPFSYLKPHKPSIKNRKIQIDYSLHTVCIFVHIASVVLENFPIHNIAQIRIHIYRNFVANTHKKIDEVCPFSANKKKNKFIYFFRHLLHQRAHFSDTSSKKFIKVAANPSLR